MRTYTQVAEDRLLTVLPGASLEPFAPALEATRSASQKMEAFYRKRLADLG
jgi:hypothetical protein